jgi:class 3 adenylate cyclase
VATPIDLESLGFTELIQLRTRLGESLQRRFGRSLCLCFTDVVDSMGYFARFGDAAGRGLHQRHFDLIRAALPAGEGRLVDTAGDGAFAVFPSADGAARALLQFEAETSRQNAAYAREHQLLVRAGLNFGQVLTDGEAVSGDAVNVAARVSGSARAGEIRITEAVFRLLPSELRLRCRGLGRFELKGLAAPLPLLSLRWRDESQFPARVRVLQTGEEYELPPLDTISFGRLREQGGLPANDIVLALSDREQSLRVSRWHFELRRHAGGFALRSVTDQATEVDGAPVARGQEVPLRPDSRVVLAGLVVLEFLPFEPVPADSDAATTGMST